MALGKASRGTCAGDGIPWRARDCTPSEQVATKRGVVLVALCRIARAITIPVETVPTNVKVCTVSRWYHDCSWDLEAIRRRVLDSPARGGRRMSDVLRFLGWLVFFLLASLTALPAPTHVLWVISVAATEWGYWLAIAAIIPLLPLGNGSKLGRIGALFSVGAIALF